DCLNWSFNQCAQTTNTKPPSLPAGIPFYYVLQGAMTLVALHFRVLFSGRDLFPKNLSTSVAADTNQPRLKRRDATFHS
ncbi:MAG: hypothetical protein NC248_11850, partial [Bacteroides sp.]|nr:hypothetical protein [Bacteroides sp.]